MHDEQEASAHPSLHPVSEAPPHPLFHQLQRDGTQVGGTDGRTDGLASERLSVCRLIPSPLLSRLYRLVQLFGGVQAAEFSSRLSPGERKNTLKDFEQGKIQL